MNKNTSYAKYRSIGKWIAGILVAVGIVPIVIMLISSISTTTGVLIERNNLSKESAVDLIQEEREHLQKTSEAMLKKMATYPEFTAKKFDRQQLAREVKKTCNANDALLTTTVADQDDNCATLKSFRRDSGRRAATGTGRLWRTWAMSSGRCRTRMPKAGCTSSRLRMPTRPRTARRAW